MRKILYIVFLLSENLLFGQSYYLFSGNAYINNNTSVITPLSGFDLLSQNKQFSSVGIGANGGMRLENNFGFEGGLGFSNQKWHFKDNTLSQFTSGSETNSFRNSMRMLNINANLHRTFKKDESELFYAKLGFDVQLIKTGTYTFDDPQGTGPQRIYTGMYDSPMAIGVLPELGFFLKADEKSEWSIYANMRIAVTSLYNLNYELQGTQNASYDILGKGNSLTLGTRYTIKKPKDTTPKEPKAKPEKEPKTPKEPKVKEEKAPKEPKVQEEKTPKEKVLKVDKDGIPKTLNDREVIKSNTIEVASTDIVFRVWDSGAMIDGDTISLNLNGEWVIQNYGLSKEKTEISAKINSDGKNFLMLYAINLGKYPPNTAAVSVWDGKTEQILELKSDLKSCGALNIVFKP